MLHQKIKIIRPSGKLVIKIKRGDNIQEHASHSQFLPFFTVLAHLVVYLVRNTFDRSQVQQNVLLFSIICFFPVRELHILTIAWVINVETHATDLNSVCGID